MCVCRNYITISAIYVIGVTIPVPKQWYDFSLHSTPLRPNTTPKKLVITVDRVFIK